MAIGPNILNDNFIKEVDLLEETIDKLLSSQRITNNSSVNIDVPRLMQTSHFQVLKERYLKAGWKDVKWNSDQREGEWLTFSN